MLPTSNVWNSLIFIIAMSVGLFTFLLLSGLCIRIAAAFCQGCQDMEWWKAFAVNGVVGGFRCIYNREDDRELYARFRSGQSVGQIIAETQSKLYYQADNYARTEYFLPHLPFFLYPLICSARLYQRFRNDLANTRTFNYFLNLQPILWSSLLTLAIYYFCLSYSDVETAQAAALLYWLNPLVILNSPIQGFLDPGNALFTALGVFAFAAGSPVLCFGALALSTLHKPLGILTVPLLFPLGLLQFTFTENILGYLTGGFVAVVVFLPFILERRVLGVIYGLLSINSASKWINAQALNPWWIFQYYLNYLNAYPVLGYRTAIRGGVGSNWFGHLEADVVSSKIGINLQRIGMVALLGATVLTICLVYRGLHHGAAVICIGAGLQIYSYFMLRVGTQNNHYSSMIPLFAVGAALSPGFFPLFCGITAIFLSQDLIFYGLGRDYDPGKEVLSRFALGWVTVPLAAVNTLLYLGVFIYLWFVG